jgi:hypothetical protein
LGYTIWEIMKLLPNKWSIGLESIFASVNAMIREQLGKEMYLPLHDCPLFQPCDC